MLYVDGIGMDGWMVTIGHRFSKSNFGANNKKDFYNKAFRG